MTFVAEYRDARRDGDVARLRRVFALRAMVASGMSQRQIGEALGVSQPAVSQQLKAAPDLAEVHPQTVIVAAGPVLKQVAEAHGFSKLAVFGSVAHHAARPDSDIDLLVEPPKDIGIKEMVRLKSLFEHILERSVDLASYGGLRPGMDDDIRRDAVLL